MGKGADLASAWIMLVSPLIRRNGYGDGLDLSLKQH